MIVKVVGIENQKFQFDDGKIYEGRKFHAINMEDESTGQVGHQVTIFKIPSTSPLSTAPVEVNKMYTVFFDQKGRVAFITENK